jgi:hypothetical protein
MTGESAQDAGNDQAEALIDEAIRAIVNEATVSAESSPTVSLLETAALASTLTSSRSSLVQQLLGADALGSALASALAPALAGQLAPRLMRYLEDTAGDRGGEQPDRPAEPAAKASTVDVRFTLPADVHADTVALCGEFNNWSAQDIQLQRGDDGSWQATVALKPGHSYRYRYLLDGKRWENARKADRYVPNSYGTTDSVIVVD